MDFELPDTPIRVGLEIHQQLATGKLFCRCPTELSEDTDATFVRRLRPTQSELGETDRAALEEAMRARLFTYEAHDATCCLVEADEEPPHELNPDALDVALTFATLTEGRPVDEVHTMRKLVIDGSNTTGFQRTALVGTGGTIPSSGGDVGLLTLCLEEDACRVVERTGAAAVYRLDRLGIPLIEIATAPTITTGEQAKEVALSIGRLLRATGKAKRGLGTIRQDINISTPEGARVEIKGVQDLDSIPEVVDNEAERQRTLVERAATLLDRGVEAADLEGDVVDLTAALDETESGLVRGAIDGGGVVLGVKLAGFEGLLGTKDDGPARLGAEMAGCARARGAKGILHSDELPGYGLTDDEVARVAKALDATGEHDAFAIVVGDAAIGRRALEAVAERATAALDGVPEETRMVTPDNWTRYLRPLPGRARMYPETDVPPATITDDRLAHIADTLPEMPEEKAARFVEEHDLPEDMAEQLALHPDVALYETAVDRTGLAREAARVILQTLPEISKTAGVDVPDDLVLEALDALDDGDFAKEALPSVLERAAADGSSIDAAVEALGLGSIDEDAVRKVAQEVVEANADVVAERGMGAMGPLMGDMMQRLRGKADGELVSRVLREAIQERVG